MNTSTVDLAFVPTSVGVNSDVNLINWSSRVQVFKGFGARGDRFYVAVPASVRNSGVRAIESYNDLASAVAAAQAIVPAYAAKLDRVHARALKMDAAR